MNIRNNQNKNTVFANKIKTVLKYDFIKGLYMCESTISCTFGHMSLIDIFTPSSISDHHFIPHTNNFFLIHNMKVKSKGWSENGCRSENIEKQYMTKCAGND